MEALGQPQEAERAYTSMVEVLPNESEGHALLAEIHQEQDRWLEAAAHWQQVARIRSLEPTGLLKLAAVQIHLGQWMEAVKTRQKLAGRSWPERFGNADSQIRQLQRQIDEARSQQ